LHYLGKAAERFGTADRIRVETAVIKPHKGHRSRFRRLLGAGRRKLRSLGRLFSSPLLSTDTDWVQASFKAAMNDWVGRLDSMDKSTCAKLLDCDLLVVHENHIAERILRFHPSAARKLAMLTHAPTFFVDELATHLFPFIPQQHLEADRVISEYRRHELEVMRSARAVIWPCPEALEGYSEWHRLTLAGAVRNGFAETGVEQPAPKTDAAELRRQWGVPPDVRVALFMGRPHPQKGWLRFLEWADWYRRNGQGRWWFFLAGPPPDMAFDLSSIHYLGYVKDYGAALLAADLVVIANLYTYFDLAALEALSLGTRLVVSPTGGNKHLLRACPALGVIPDGSPEVVCSAFDELAADYANNPEKSASLIKTWETRFSLEPFLRNHQQVAEQLLAS
jgi:glycosyltransferase involved in cell wall biosynthesis